MTPAAARRRACAALHGAARHTLQHRQAQLLSSNDPEGSAALRRHTQLRSPCYSCCTRPQVLKTPQKTLVSSIFFMCLPDKVGSLFLSFFLFQVPQAAFCALAMSVFCAAIRWQVLQPSPLAWPAAAPPVCLAHWPAAHTPSGCLLHCLLLPCCGWSAQVLVYGDCAVNVEPTPEELSQVGTGGDGKTGPCLGAPA